MLYQPIEGQKTGSYYTVQTRYTHETKVWGNPNSKFVPYDNGIDPEKWGNMSLGILHKVMKNYSPQEEFQTLKEARQAKKWMEKFDKQFKIDEFFNYSGSLMRRTKHKFRIVKCSYLLNTEVIE